MTPSLRSRPCLRHRMPPARWAVIALLLALAACASVQPPAAGDARPAPAGPETLSGQVSNVDHGNRRFLLEDGAGVTADVAYDAGTRLVSATGAQPVSTLRPGERVRVLAAREGRLWRASRIERPGGGGADGTEDAAEERQGVVAGVDRASRVIAYTRGGFAGGEDSVRYDSATVVEYQGRRYPVEALEQGDLVRLQLRRSDRGWIATRILVETSARDR